MPLFIASNGEYYTASEVVEHMESGRWSPCLWDEASGKQLVETDGTELLLLVPAENADSSAAFEGEPAP